MPQLIAYVIPVKGFQTEEKRRALGRELKAWLGERLPMVMLPGGWQFLDSFPLNPNGKIDRAQLPLPDSSGHGENEYIAPVTETERLLCELWQEVMGVERVGTADNFFELGGTSLTIITMTRRAARKGLSISVKAAYENPLLSDLVNFIYQQESLPHRNDVEDEATYLPLTPNIAFSLNGANGSWNKWIYWDLLQGSEIFAPEVLKKAISKVINRHEALRLRFKKRENNSWVNILISGDNNLSFEVFNCQGKEDSFRKVSELKTIMENRSDIEAGPLIQVALLQSEQEGISRILLAIHHYVVDAISFDLLMEEAFYYYVCQVTERDEDLPYQSGSYRKYAMSLVEYANSEICISHGEYWQKLATSQALTIPLDKDNLGITSWRVSEIKQKIPLPLSRVKIDYHALAVAALVLGFRRWSGQQAIYLNLIQNGRMNSDVTLDLSQTVGWLSHLTPVLIKTESDLVSLDTIGFISEQLKAVPNDNSLGLLRYCHKDKAVREKMLAIPEPQVNFNYFEDITSQAESSSEFESPTHLVRSINEEQNHQQEYRVTGSKVREHILCVTCHVSSDAVSIGWNYVVEIHYEDSIQMLHQCFENALRELFSEALMMQTAVVSKTGNKS
ncbi:hypothetical protein KIH87_10565 [Paraneptunicella aestuarii]|uniref:condensation domain-containing protein n=1 Tax=Paraneptunicella aestuarii TaxID=2831148 RepID=UPI001E4F3B4F|nr:condensation domain-containing protein [Paraneptunicella aestuarii]UAA37191.1 hypothetical protein KIH87_10565 [Paraneptunicella aestuarii]